MGRWLWGQTPSPPQPYTWHSALRCGVCGHQVTSWEHRACTRARGRPPPSLENGCPWPLLRKLVQLPRVRPEASEQRQERGLQGGARGLPLTGRIPGERCCWCGHLSHAKVCPAPATPQPHPATPATPSHARSRPQPRPALPHAPPRPAPPPCPAPPRAPTHPVLRPTPPPGPAPPRPRPRITCWSYPSSLTPPGTRFP